jgi:D-lactate dehydrogenase (cytochrome)
MSVQVVQPFSDEYEGYLRDESRRVGNAACIAFPRTEAEIIAAIRDACGVITVQGARTGIVAGAVPDGGCVLNLSRMNADPQLVQDGGSGEPYLVVQPGVLLTQIREVLTPHQWYFPPDPTEASASIGGMAACNASGALTFAYGSTREWVRGLRMVLADGSVLALRRGQCRARGRDFALTTEDGRTIAGQLPAYRQPAVKSVAGYYVADDMDLLDLFIGMEGTLGIITEIELRLIPRPAAMHGLMVYLPSEAAALSLVRAMRGEAVSELPAVNARPQAIEFFNADALNFLRNEKAENPAFTSIPTLHPHYHTALYLEFHGEDDEALEGPVLEVIEVMLALGASDEDTWYATTAREMEAMKAFRHAVPEAVNLTIDTRKREEPALTKLGTDMSVPDATLTEAMAMYRADLDAAGLESVIFGHIGNNHVHVNILPRNLDEYARGKALYLDWAQRVVQMGGSVAAEHGIGKLKVPFLDLMYGEEGIAQMRALKALFDPDSRLNPGNLFT